MEMVNFAQTSESHWITSIGSPQSREELCEGPKKEKNKGNFHEAKGTIKGGSRNNYE